MYSVNHMHEGAAKTWYVVPASAASKFERAAKALAPHLFDRCPDLLAQLVMMVSPFELRLQGVPVYKIRQRAGDFVVTFPRAYHAGFSHGFNLAEAVNFATVDWLPFGRNAMCQARRFKRTPVFSMERLLFTLARGLLAEQQEALDTLEWLCPELQAVTDEELKARHHWACDLGLPLRPLASVMSDDLITDDLGLPLRPLERVLPAALPRPSEPMATARNDDLRNDDLRNDDLITEPTATARGAAPEAAAAAEEEERHSCEACSRILYFSGVVCSCRRFACLRHAGSLTCCKPAARLGWQRFPDAELQAPCTGLQAMLQRARSAQPA